MHPTLPFLSLWSSVESGGRAGKVGLRPLGPHDTYPHGLGTVPPWTPQGAPASRKAPSERPGKPQAPPPPRPQPQSPGPNSIVRLCAVNQASAGRWGKQAASEIRSNSSAPALVRPPTALGPAGGAKGAGEGGLRPWQKGRLPPQSRDLEGGRGGDVDISMSTLEGPLGQGQTQRSEVDRPVTH